jgi:hypothetical protein
MAKNIKADCGSVIKAGDKISSSYGIPPTRICGNVFSRDGELWVSVDGNHKPKLASLKEFKETLFVIYKETP